MERSKYQKPMGGIVDSFSGAFAGFYLGFLYGNGVRVGHNIRMAALFVHLLRFRRFL
jgi:hypothetical protein